MEEQNEEIEVLTSIFPEELEIINSDPNQVRIHLIPNPGTDDNHVGVYLNCTFPPEYPALVIPLIEIEIEKGLGKKHVDELKELVARVANENIGMPSIFSIAEAAREWLRDNNIAGQDGSMYADMMRRMQTKDVETKKKAAQAAIVQAANNEGQRADETTPEELERIRRRQAGKPVTVESFLEWKSKFDAENNGLGGFSSVVFTEIVTAVKSSSNNSSSSGPEDSLTGKQWFLQNMGDRSKSSGAEEVDEEAIITAGELEDIELNEDLLLQWASEAAYGDEGEEEEEEEEFDENDISEESDADEDIENA